MVNAGAIVTTSLVTADNPEARFERIRLMLSSFAGRDLTIDQAVYLSEVETGDRNRALGYLMRNAGSLTSDVDEALDVYFRQCAVLVTTRDLAVMAATLANGGVNPVTGQRVVTAQVASHVLTVMGTCGMYDFSGEWLLRVGLPAKSGVSGCVVAAKAAQFGLGVFSPRLDERGNSVRAIEVCRDVAERFDLHLFNLSAGPASTSYLEETGLRMHSPSVRDDHERTCLQAHGHAIAIRSLQGDIGFAAAESVMHSCDALTGDATTSPHWLILDMHRAGRLYQVARMMLEAMVTHLNASGVEVVVVDPGRREYLPDVPAFDSLDDALEHCENHLLSHYS
jgi:glutaminase